MSRPSTGRRAALVGALLASVALAAPIASQARTKPKAPHAATGGARHVSDSSAELTGTVNPRGLETNYTFQFGSTTGYGAQTPIASAGSSVGGVKVSQVLSGLPDSATYHYRLVAVNSSGETVDGLDRTFTTKSAIRTRTSTPKPIELEFVLPKAPIVAAYGHPFSVTGTLSGVGGANRQIVLQASPFPYMSPFSDLGSPTTTNARGGFSLRVPSVTQNTKLRVSALAPTTYSRVVTVQVAVRVTLRARAAGQGLVRLEGTVTPAEAGAPVVFQQLRTGRRPANVGGTQVKRGPSGVSRFSALVSIRHGGYYRALVKVSNGRQVSGSSGTVFLHAAPTVRKASRVHLRAHLHRRR
jgi:hypothetical protein